MKDPERDALDIRPTPEEMLARIRQEGTLSSTGRVYFKATKARFWTWAENMVEVRARVGVDCGYVDLYADPAKLKKLVKP